MIVTGAGDGAAIENIAPVRSMRVDGPGAWRISKFSTNSADTMCMDGEGIQTRERPSRAPSSLAPGVWNGYAMGSPVTRHPSSGRNPPMAFTLPELPYETTALEPYLSAETFEYHYGKHHKTYIDTLNGMIEGTDEENASLEDIILSSEGKKFNQAAQVWNHTLYWNSMAPGGGGAPTGAAGDAVNEAFGSLRQVPRGVQDRGDRPVRLRLGVADARRRQARHLVDRATPTCR